MHEAKTHLSRHIKQMKAGDRLILCNRNLPVAEIRLLQENPPRPRKLGVARGDFVIPGSFFEPLPEALLRAFQGPPQS